jgi:hypothetical protein
MKASRSSVGVKRRISGGIDLVPILKAIGYETILAGPDRKQFSRLIRRRLSDARAHYNTRLDFGLTNQELSHRANNLAGVERSAADLCQRLRNQETDYQLRTDWPDRISFSGIRDRQEFQEEMDASHLVPSPEALRNVLRALELHAKNRRRAIEKTAKVAPVKGGLNAELTAYLAVVFEEIFGRPFSYSREQKEDASANKCGRFVNAVFEQFGLRKRKLGSIANDLTKMRPRIQELKRLRRTTQ